MADLSVQRLFLWISFLVTIEKLALGRLELQAACEPNLDLLLFKHNDQHSIVVDHCPTAAVDLLVFPYCTGSAILQHIKLNFMSPSKML